MAYPIERVRKEFKEICDKANVELIVPISANGRLTVSYGRVVIAVNSCSGKCYPEKVEFSKTFLENGDEDFIYEVILHEAAHYIATMRTKKDQNHNAYFKSVCAEIGANGASSATSEEAKRANMKYKYEIICPNCKTIYTYARAGSVVKYPESATCPCGHTGLEVKQNW